ncbi:Sugar transferase involved in LPS biosynthesis (colanic, teichoic acid) [bacterium A37T11]|nr:Sugar transferase involved in LPS biosynthesis (colanic, teichoic acid) [bacterium A37T11]
MNSLIENKVKPGLGAHIAYVGTAFGTVLDDALSHEFEFDRFSDFESISHYLSVQTLLTIPDVIMMEIDEHGKVFDLVKKIKANPVTGGLIIILFTDTKNSSFQRKAMELRIHDLYIYPFNIDNLIERIYFLIKFKLVKPTLQKLPKTSLSEYKMAWQKRVFDMICSSILLLILSPILIIVAILIKLDSKGPIIYKSKRAGTGYQVFDFFKFRSMRQDADKLLKELSAHNQYAQTNDGKNSAFVKIKNDPRITRLGNLLRKTSLDELPQLFNVLKGDMSMVGNRPLPLYEAEMLTSNEWSMRFLGPAGITGLWQITKRGKSEMSDIERRELDNFYAKNYSFWIDLKIILKTFPALLQKEKV